jgi:hypothetical protein
MGLTLSLSTTWRGRIVSLLGIPFTASITTSAAMVPLAVMSWRTVLILGKHIVAKGTSSNPIMDKSSGMDQPKCEWHNKREKFRLIKMENFQPVPLVNW